MCELSRTVPMMTAVGGLAAFVVLTAACGGSPEPQPRESADEQPMVARESAAGCDVAGEWRLTETIDAARGCDEPWDPLLDARLRLEQHDDRLTVEYLPANGTEMICSGVSSDETCSIEITCRANVRDETMESMLELQIDSEEGSLSGNRTAHLAGSDCRITTSVEGERESSG